MTTTAGVENPIAVRIGKVAAPNAAQPMTGAAPIASTLGKASAVSRMTQKTNQIKATVAITLVRLLPSIRLRIHSCEPTIVVVLKKKMTPMTCTGSFKLFTTKRL